MAIQLIREQLKLHAKMRGALIAILNRAEARMNIPLEKLAEIESIQTILAGIQRCEEQIQNFQRLEKAELLILEKEELLAQEQLNTENAEIAALEDEQAEEDEEAALLLMGAFFRRI